MTHPKICERGIALPQALIPSKEINLERWAVIACDQYAAEPSIWRQWEESIAGSPSTLSMILPECFLGKDDPEKVCRRIVKKMEEALTQKYLVPAGEGAILVERHTRYERVRKGLLFAIDLDEYDFSPNSSALIRPTEATVINKLPPRIENRREALLDLSHIILLLDDPECTVIEPLQEMEKNFELLYDFDLMENGGRIIGRQLPIKITQEVTDKMALLERDGLLFAVGDGNHSLAAAKTVWKELKEDGAPPDHPARFALVEIVNIHDSGVPFEPIHRLITVNDTDAFLHLFQRRFSGSIKKTDEEKGRKHLNSEDPMAARWLIKSPKNIYFCEGIKGPFDLDVEPLQKILDNLLDEMDFEIEYIHGEKSLFNLTNESGKVGFLMPSINKDVFFEMIRSRGPLARKSFSIGEAEEKRYYLETRRLRNRT